MTSSYWHKVASSGKAFARGTKKQRTRSAKVLRSRWYTQLALEALEGRLAPAVTALLDNGVLQVALSAANDQALITPSGTTILVSGTNLPSQPFSGVTSLVVQGANTSGQDDPNQSVVFGGSGGTIGLHSASGTDALSVSGVTSVSFTNVTIAASSGDVDIEVSETTSAAGVAATTKPQVSVSVTGATLTADNITLNASASSSYSSSTPLGGVLNAAGAAMATADLEPSATVAIGSSSTITAGGNLTISSDADAKIDFGTKVGLDVLGNALNPAEAAIAFSIVNSSAVTHVGGGSQVSAGTGADTLSITSTNTTDVTTDVDGSAAAGGASGAVTLDNSTSQAFVDGGSKATGGTVSVLATTTNTADTSAKSTATGAGTNSAIQNILAGIVDPAYIAKINPAPNPVDKTSPADTLASGGLPLTVAGSVAVTKFTPTTQAYVDSSTVTATNAINIGASSTNNTSTTADSDATTSNATLSVGVAVAINDSVVSNTATVSNTAGTTSLTAPTITVQAATPTTSDPTPNILNSTASATSGVSGLNVGAAGALALNVVSNTSEASIPSGSTVAMNGDVTFNALDTATETASSQPPFLAVGGVGGKVGVGASVALDIATNTTLADLQNTAQLTGANDLTLNAGSNDTVSTNAVAGSSGGTVSFNPSAGITVVTNTTAAQVGAPDAAKDALMVGGDFSATATHVGLESTPTGAASLAGSTASAGVALALAFATDHTTATTLRLHHCPRRQRHVPGRRLGGQCCLRRRQCLWRSDQVRGSGGAQFGAGRQVRGGGRVRYGRPQFGRRPERQGARPGRQREQDHRRQGKHRQRGRHQERRQDAGGADLRRVGHRGGRRGRQYRRQRGHREHPRRPHHHRQRPVDPRRHQRHRRRH